MGPRHTTALSEGVKKPMDINLTPYCSIGMMIFLPSSCRTPGCSASTLNITGIDGPEISASTNPTLAPFCANATAKLEAQVDLPTPPLPDAMAIIFLTPGSSFTLFREVETLDVIK